MKTPLQSTVLGLTETDALTLFVTTGIRLLPALLGPEMIGRWQRAMDDAFDHLDRGRSYLDASWVVRSGLLREVFSDKLRRLVFDLMPDAFVYHCHVYEIPGEQNLPHIHGERLSGWHRDDETIAEHRRDECQFLSLFVYLSEVKADSGAFEFLPSPPRTPFINRRPALAITGPVGTSFLWNRSYFHRASPNRSSIRRRLFKLSIQPRRLRNTRLGLQEFERARAFLAGTDPFLESLFGLSSDALLPKPRLPSESLLAAEPVGLARATTIRVRRRDEVAVSLKTGLQRLRVGSA